MSAYFLFSMVPNLSYKWRISAFTVVAMRKVYNGLAPYCT